MTYKSYYDERRHETYAHEIHNDDPTQRKIFASLKAFINTYRLHDKKCLEIGSGRGLFQDIVTDYTGTDIAESVSKYYHKPYKVDGLVKSPNILF